MVIADALVFEVVGDDIVQPMLRDPAFPQYLLRALISRAVTDHLARRRARHPPGTEAPIADTLSVITLLTCDIHSMTSWVSASVVK